MKNRIRYSELAVATPPEPMATYSPTVAHGPLLPSLQPLPALVPVADALLVAPAPAAFTMRASAPIELARAIGAAQAAQQRDQAAVATALAIEADGSSRRASLRPLRERARLRRGMAELLLFRVHHELFAVELGAVEEAIDMPEVHHVPEMTPCMLGVITVRGSLTAVFSPEHVLGLPLESCASALVFRRGRSRLAIVVDDIDDVVTMDLAELRDASDEDGVVLGVARHLDALVAVLDADALIAACQALPALETA